MWKAQTLKTITGVEIQEDVAQMTKRSIELNNSTKIDSLL